MAKHPKKNSLEQCILIVGDPGDGFEFYGPFDAEPDAISYAEDNIGDKTWWVKRLAPVQCDDEGNWI